MSLPNPFSPVARPHGRRYCLVTPCRNEARFIRTTLETTCAQTALPSLWVIVDDGSTDETPQILADFAARYPFIQIVKRADRGRRAVGPGVIEAFYDGLARVDLDSFDYVTKFDGDLELPPRYFERSMERMEAEGTDKAQGSKASVTISKNVVANVTDWDELWPYIVKNKFYGLVQRRVTDTAYRELLDLGKKVPGVEPFTKRALTVRSL